MPKCKNDPTRTYKGTEPSPKGLGYCAHAEKLNKKRKGKDGKNWIIAETKNGVKRWVKDKESSKEKIIEQDDGIEEVKKLPKPNKKHITYSIVKYKNRYFQLQPTNEDKYYWAWEKYPKKASPMVLSK